MSATAKEALGRAATEVGTSTTTGDGGMTPEERKASSLLVYQVLPSRYGFDPADLRQADAVEIVIGQGAKPGGGGLLLGQKVNERVAAMRTLPPGIDQRSASRHPDWVGPDDLRIKIEELREATGWQIPIYVKIGATRVDHDVQLAVAAGADVVVVDGMQGGTAATQDVFIEHAGIPTLPAVRMAAEALRARSGHARRCSWSSPAGSAREPTWPRHWRSGRTPCPSAWPPCSPSAATARRSATRDGTQPRRRRGLRRARHGRRPLRPLPHRSVPRRHRDPGRRRSRRGSIPSTPPPRWPTTCAPSPWR